MVSPTIERPPVTKSDCAAPGAGSGRGVERLENIHYPPGEPGDDIPPDLPVVLALGAILAIVVALIGFHLMPEIADVIPPPLH